MTTSSAYDLSLFSKNERGKVISIEENKKQRHEAKRRTRRQTLVSAVMVIVVVAIVLSALIIAINSKARLTQMNVKLDELNSQLSILQSENVRLNSELTQIASVEKINAYAEKHGLQKMETGQIEYFTVNGEDVVEKPRSETKSFWATILGLF